MNRFIFYVACDTADLTGTDLTVVQDNIAQFLHQLSDDPILAYKSAVSVIEFGWSAEVLMPPTSVMEVTSVPLLGGTSGPADFAALFRLLRFLVPRDVRATRRTATVQDLAVLIVTKGQPAQTAWESELAKMVGVLERVGMNQEVPVVAVGLAGADENFLSAVGRWHSRKLFFRLDDGGDLGDVAREIRGLLRSEPISDDSSAPQDLLWKLLEDQCSGIVPYVIEDP